MEDFSSHPPRSRSVVKLLITSSRLPDGILSSSGKTPVRDGGCELREAFIGGSFLTDMRAYYSRLPHIQLIMKSS